jgi:hypothetical protein
VSDREILSRIDEHMARGNEHMVRGNELMDRGNELMAENTQLMAELRQERRETRQFMRDLTRRNEIVFGELVRECRHGQEVLLGVRDSLSDLHEESLAQREAIWTMIDELREHGLGGRG